MGTGQGFLMQIRSSVAAFAAVVTVAGLALHLQSRPAAASTLPVVQQPSEAQSIAGQSEVVVVLNSGDSSISLLDEKTGAEIRRIPVGKEPHHLIITPDEKALVVASSLTNELLLLDPVNGAPIKRITHVTDPYQLGFSPDGKWLVTNGFALQRVDIYSHDHGSSLRLERRLKLPQTPSHMAFTADSQLLFVTLQDSDELAAIDLPTQRLLWKMKTGKQPAGVRVTGDGNYLLVGMTGDDYVSVIDWRAQREIKRIKTGRGAHNFLSAGDGRHVYVSNRVADTITVLDEQTLTKVDEYQVPGGPDCMELSADGKRLWVTARWARKVVVIDLPSHSIALETEVGRSPHGIYFRSHAART